MINKSDRFEFKHCSETNNKNIMRDIEISNNIFKHIKMKKLGSSPSLFYWFFFSP